MSAQTEIQEVFLAAVKAFKAHSVPGVMQYIDPTAPVIYSITGQIQQSGFAAVKGYFASEFATNNPNFDPAGIPAPSINATNTSAFLSGTATWTSTNSSSDYPNGYPLQYVFTFVQRDNQPWRILTMWGS